MQNTFLIGTSGFGYSDWVENNVKTRIPFYPQYIKDNQRLAYYSEIFPTVEINTTFYHYPRPSIVERWAKQSPEHFIFSYKIPRLITHERKLQEDYWADLMRFIELMSPLNRKLGPALLQLPPKFSTSYMGNLKLFLKNWPSELQLAVEFREPSWITQQNLQKTLSLLTNANTAYCIVDEPLLPPITPTTADFSYIRFHGHGLKPWYNYEYSEEELKNWIPKLKELTERTQEVFTYFNNHPAGSAPSNARQLAILLKMPLKKSESIDIAQVRKRAGDSPQHSLETFFPPNNSDFPIVDKYIRYCSDCGAPVLREDLFCESCGNQIEPEEN
ncbi:DUF72 domain-containing protein [Candidatus Hodarchaeum mangrovi]